MEKITYNDVYSRIDVRSITDCMQMRICVNNYEAFECGMDIYTLVDGKHIVCSTVGIYGDTLAHFVKNYLKYIKGENFTFKYIVLKDDPIDDDRINPIIEDNYLLKGIEPFAVE